MIRIVFLALAVFLIIYKLYKINKKVLCAKTYIFIKEIKEKTPIEEANYKANLFDFFKHKDAKNVFAEMEKVLSDDYNKQMDKMIFRAENWGFIDTHTKTMFKKRKRIRKLLEHFFLTQESDVFSGDATKASKDIIQKFWDKKALLISTLDDKITALKLLLCEYEDDNKKCYQIIARQIANTLKNETEYLDKADLEVLNAWNDIIKENKEG